MPRPLTPVQIPIALGRSSIVKTWAVTERVEGTISAPPTPIAGPKQDQRLGRRSEGAGQRADAEDDQPDEHHPAPAEPVAQRAGREQQAGEQEHVCVDHPLQLARVRMQIAGERGQGDVEDRVVQVDGEETDDEDGEDPPAAAVEGRVRHLCCAPVLARTVDDVVAGTRYVL